MVQLNRSMMERYEIADRRPQTLRAVIFGADRLMLGAVARMLDLANESGADLGAACVTGKAASLNAQDGMFTMLIRGETLDGQATREERVVQSVLLAVDPRADEKKYLALGLLPELEYLFVDAEADEAKSMLLAQLLYARFCGGSGFIPMSPDFRFGEGDRITAAGTTFTVLHTPGHTPGSCCFDSGEVLFTGDTLFAVSCGRVDFDGGDPAAMQTSLARLSALPGDRACYPGHDRAFTLGSARAENPMLHPFGR